MAYLLPLAQFSAQALHTPDKPYLHQPVKRQLQSLTWAEVDTQARCLAQTLLDQGLQPGDRVGLLSKNCAQWVICDLAIMMAGLISVPLFHTANRQAIQFVVEHSECKLVLVGKLDGKKEAEAGLPKGITRIALPYDTLDADIAWEQAIAGSQITAINQAKADDTMTIVYTSGSTGQPKGVVLSYNNMAAAAFHTKDHLGSHDKDHVISYLPLAHIVERSMIETASYYTGSQIFFVESLRTFVDDVKLAAPDLFVSVPRMWLKFQAEIQKKMPQKKLQLLLKIPFVNRIVKNKIQTNLGLRQTRVYGCGSAPVSAATLRWFNSIGIGISEGWGMTETAGLACINAPFKVSAIGTIGKAIPCVEIKVNDKKEILVRGAAIFKEYYKNPVDTELSFSDGWFHTGDMGELDSNGNVRIIGRLKEQFKTTKGKYVSPVPIESLLAQNSDIEQVCVMGTGLSQPVAIVLLHEIACREKPAALARLEYTLKSVNRELESHEKIGHLIVVNDQWTPENHLLTPTMKIVRPRLEEKYAELLTQKLSGKVIALED